MTKRWIQSADVEVSEDGAILVDVSAGGALHAPFSAAGDGAAKTLVAAPGEGLALRLLALAVTHSHDAAQNVTIDDSGGTALVTLHVDRGAVLPSAPRGWGQAAENTALRITAANGTLTGTVVYEVVPA